MTMIEDKSHAAPHSKTKDEIDMAAAGDKPKTTAHGATFTDLHVTNVIRHGLFPPSDLARGSRA
jgi:hypothetical protein